jgi:selenide,water dikinase
MKSIIEPIAQELVLLGGGHTHAIALRLLGMHPLPGVRLTLISDASESAYSGMLPGRIAGFYTDEECHVNLCTLAEFAGAQLYIDRAIGLDLDNRRVICDRHPPVAFDILSIDIGSTPSQPPGLTTAANVMPAKPVRPFLDRWDALLKAIHHHPDRPFTLAIVGGGAAGAELALTMQHRIQAILQAHQQPLTHLEVHLIQRGNVVVPQFNPNVRRILTTLFQQRQIQVHLNEAVEAIAHNTLRCKSGFALTCDAIVWVTQASAPDWLTTTGLTLDEQGFIQVSDTLQSLSHPCVFAAGDVATMVNYPRPKAGVFAVRQGKPLVHNLRRYCQNQPLKPFRPQKQYLSLINTADGQAIAARGRWGWRSPLLWRWKDHIDRSFMDRLNHLPVMSPTPRRGASSQNLESNASSSPLGESGAADTMRCAGCGSKVGGTVLSRVLHRIQTNAVTIPDGPSSIVIGLNQPDDAAVIQTTGDRLLVQTVDFFPALLADPFVFGQIAANHALSDLYAMGAIPHSALAIATIPYGVEKALEESLYQLLSGALQGVRDVGAELIGGHTIEGTELALGLACNGFVPPERLLRKGGMQPGQVLILTKPLGTGTLFAAKMRYQALGRWIDEAVESMLRSNYQAAQCLIEHGATACTDVTGFGLVGHLLEMLQVAQVSATLKLEAVPALNGALATLDRGIVSSLQAQNLRSRSFIDCSAQIANSPLFQLLFDPQTSGGLLATIPPDQVTDCLTQLQALGYGQSVVIGQTQPLTTGHSLITIR